MQKYAAVLAKPHAAYTAAVAAEVTADAADATIEATELVAARTLTQFVTIYTTLEFVGIHRTPNLTPRLVCDEWVYPSRFKVLFKIEMRWICLELVWVQPFWPRSCVILAVHPLEDVLDEQGWYGVEGVPRMPPVAVEVPGLRVV